MRGRCSLLHFSAVVIRVPSRASSGSGSGRFNGLVAPVSAATHARVMAREEMKQQIVRDMGITDGRYRADRGDNIAPAVERQGDRPQEIVVLASTKEQEDIRLLGPT